jgi:ribonucleoside-diphosphate reductase alpha chain
MVITRRPLEPLVADRLEQGIEQCQRWLRERTESTVRETNFPAATVRKIGAPAAVPTKMAEFADIQADAKKTRLDDRVFALDKPSQAAILRGLFTVHGNVLNYGEDAQCVSLDCASTQLLEQVQLLLLGFGIRSMLGVRRRALGQVITVSPNQQQGIDENLVEESRSLWIMRESRVRFEEQIGFLEGSAKVERLAELNRDVPAAADPLVDRVALLKPCGEEDVYDLTEPVTNHFVANGIVVHNCSEYMFLDDTACNLASINSA